MVQVCSSRTEKDQCNNFTKYSDDTVSTLERSKDEQDLEILKLLEEEIVESFTENREKKNSGGSQAKHSEDARGKLFSSGLHGKKIKFRSGQRTVRLVVVESVVESSSNSISQQNKARSLRAQAQLIQCETKTLTIDENERDRGARAGVPVVTLWKSNCRIATFF
ncbi:hypothetical protein TNCV_747361 [Trichonephila clavipes]|nr:hypothetical protein TNCV_747361 [Trichonephila clavipes]